MCTGKGTPVCCFRTKSRCNANTQEIRNANTYCGAVELAMSMEATHRQSGCTRLCSEAWRRAALAQTPDKKSKNGLGRESNPGPLAPEASIIPLDHTAAVEVGKSACVSNILKNFAQDCAKVVRSAVGVYAGELGAQAQ